MKPSDPIKPSKHQPVSKGMSLDFTQKASNEESKQVKKLHTPEKKKEKEESPPQFYRINEDDGLEYEVVNVFGHHKLLEAVRNTGSIKRYINPKMERELCVFKKKILARHA